VDKKSFSIQGQHLWIIYSTTAWLSVLDFHILALVQYRLYDTLRDEMLLRNFVGLKRRHGNAKKNALQSDTR
jgi:hypothetical protein